LIGLKLNISYCLDKYGLADYIVSEFQAGKAMRSQKKKKNIIQNKRSNGLLNVKGSMADNEVDEFVNNIYAERSKAVERKKK